MNRTLVALGLFLPGPLAAQGVRFDAGLGVTSGTYLFEERTNTWSLSAGLALEEAGFILRGVVPLHYQNTTLVNATGTGHIPTGGSSSGTVADSGEARGHRGDSPMGRGSSHGAVDVPASAVTGYEAAVGDPTVSLSWRSRGTGATSFGLGGVMKIPVADTAAFGTGEWDVGVTAGASHRLGGRFLLGVDLAYWRLGDLEDLELRDPVYGTASLAYLSANRWGTTILVSGGTAVLRGFDAPISVGAALHRLAGATSWSLLSTVGLTETAPDLTVGLLWRVRLAR
jgi:hypothetical protein